MRPMENIHVVELSIILTGPMTARVPAKWGTDTVKMESVNGDAWYKQAGTMLSSCTKDANPNFDVQNMSRRFVCLNLRTETGRDAMMKLLSKADIFIINYRIQVLESMGLTYEQFEEVFPYLIRTSVLGYDSGGPESSRPGYDCTVLFVRTGLMANPAPAGGPPLIPVGGIGDRSVTVALSRGIATALYKRSVTGEGDKVDASLLQAGTFINCTGILNNFSERKLPRDRYDCGHAGSNAYRGSDEGWFYLAIIGYQRFPEFCQVIDIPGIATDPRFSTSDAYYESRGELTRILGERFAEQPVSHQHELLDAHDPPHEVLHRSENVPYDLQVWVNHYTYFHEYSDEIKTVFSNGSAHFGSIDPSAILCRISGSVGRDADEVLKEIGYADEQIRATYRSEGIK